MKVKFVTVFLLLAVLSCKKEYSGIMNNLQGKWELVSYDGAWVGHIDYAPGNDYTYTFTGNNYSLNAPSADTVYKRSGTFRIYTGKPCDYAAEQTLIEFDSVHENPSKLSITDGKLVIGTTECIADGGYQTFRKISN